MNKAGQKAVFKAMEDKEYLRCLEEKLDEEVAEFHESNQLDELAGILEVVYALSEAQGRSVDEQWQPIVKSTKSGADSPKRSFSSEKKQTERRFFPHEVKRCS